MVTRIDWPGTWIDVVGDRIARVAGRAVVVEQVLPDRTRRLLWTVDCQEAPMFIRLAVAPDGTAAVVGKGHETGAALLVLQSGSVALGATNGNNPIAIYYDGSQFVVLWTEVHGVLARLTCGNGEHTSSPIPPPWTGTSQGILDLRPDGSVIYMDEGRIAHVDGITLWKPNVRAGVYVGQADPPGAKVAFQGGLVFVALEGDVDDPHLSVAPSGRILVVAYTPQGASLAIADVPPDTPDKVPGPIVNTLVKCEVTVDRFTLTSAAHLPDGPIAEFHDRANPQGAHVRMWVENGSCRMAIDYPGVGLGLQGETSALRHVR